MTAVQCAAIGLLISFVHLHRGACGEDFNVYSSEGDDVTLPCANVVYPNCSSTVWIYNSPRSQVTIEVVTHGKIRHVNSDRAERLKVESGCSLHISQIRAQDAGLYICRQDLRKDGPQHENEKETRVFLSILKISSSIPVTELRNGSTLTLTCLLETYQYAGCESGHRETRLQWVDSAPAQVEVKSPCKVTLTVTLKREDHRRELVCQHIVKGEVKISLHYIITLSGIDENFNTGVHIITIPVLLLLLLLGGAAVICWRYRGRTNGRTASGEGQTGRRRVQENKVVVHSNAARPAHTPMETRDARDYVNATLPTI